MVSSTTLSYNNARDMVLAQQEAIGRLSQQMSSGKSMLTPSDDPLGAARSITLRQADSVNTTFASNRATATANLASEGVVLSSTVTAMQSALQALVSAGNGTLSDTDRASYATQLQSLRDSLLGYANTRDVNGSYQFSGYAGSTAPFSESGDYLIGDAQNQSRLVQADATTSISTSDVGSDIFARANPGSQGYIASAGTAATPNTGTGTFSSIAFDASGANAGKNFDISFTDDGAGGLVYHVATIDSTGTRTDDAFTGAYVDGGSLDLGGATLTLSGQPKASDTFSVETNSTADLNVFKTLDAVIAALKTPVSGDPVAQANLTNALNTANKKLTESYNNVLTVQSSNGTRTVRLLALDTIGVAKTETLSQQLSAVENVDVVSAVSDLALRQAALTASSLAFKAIQSSHIYTQS